MKAEIECVIRELDTAANALHRADCALGVIDGSTRELLAIDLSVRRINKAVAAMMLAALHYMEDKTNEG